MVRMRTTHFVLCSMVMATAACGVEATGGGMRGATMKQHQGTVAMVFTNASPQQMCGLHMTFEGEGKFGDNWLPAGGVAPGQSVEFKVKPGKYKANWNTCMENGQPYAAATLAGEWAFEVKDATQLFAYVAGTTAPTKHAAPRDFHALVKFPGQTITPGVAPQRDAGDQTAQADRDPNARSTGAVSTEKFDASDWVEKPSKRSSKPAKLKPTAGRKHDVGNAKVSYATR